MFLNGQKLRQDKNSQVYTCIKLCQNFFILQKEHASGMFPARFVGLSIGINGISLRNIGAIFRHCVSLMIYSSFRTQYISAAARNLLNVRDIMFLNRYAVAVRYYYCSYFVTFACH